MKTKLVNKVRTVAKVIDGKAHTISEDYAEDEPVMPRDMEGAVLKSVFVTVSMIVLAAVIWSAYSIGALLSLVAPPWVAYMIAVVFDMSWIMCMALEWLSRYDKDRAALPKKAGWFALTLSMTMIALHGAYSGHLVIGVAGALVSFIAKGLWVVLMRHTAVSMDAATMQWVAAERSEIHGQLATMRVRRELQRAKARLSDEALALAIEQSASDPVSVSVSVTDGRTDEEDSVRVSAPVRPLVSEAVPVSAPRPPAVSAASVPVRPLVSAASEPRPPAVSARLSVSGRVRELVSEGLSDDMVREIVAVEFGDVKKDSLSKALYRARR